MALTDRPPGRVIRLLFRLPLVLYRLRLGPLLGRRFLLLAHRGRRTGALRETVLEVVRFDQVTGEAAVVAAWGPRAQWYRNLRHAGAVEVRIGRRRYRQPHQRFLAPGEAAALMDGYRWQHPLAARLLGRLLGRPTGDPAGWAAFAGSVHAVAFRPAPRTEPAANPGDLSPFSPAAALLGRPGCAAHRGRGRRTGRWRGGWPARRGRCRWPRRRLPALRGGR
jgi:deazaflavin-dependent oxidoreductase (nitroreductase family)